MPKRIVVRPGRVREAVMMQNRRHFLSAMGIGGLFFTTKGAFAQQLVLTPEQTIGPYYPDRLPLDQDNDLLIISDGITPAVGTISWITGRVLTASGEPVRNALVEIWQADNNGAYIHSASPIANRDRNFQGYGKFLTASNGEYLFRTVKPGLYPGRTRHIHFKVTFPGGRTLVTQLYVQGEALNTNDGVLNGIRDAASRASVIVPWNAVPGSAIGELAARFDLVANYTPSETSPGTRPALVPMSGVVNGASFYPGIASGSWITLFGSNLAPATRTWRSSDFTDGKLPANLDGVSVSVNNQPASVYYISPTQLNVQAPAQNGGGQVQVSVTTPSGTSTPVSVELKPVMPAFFQLADEYIAAVRSDGSYITAEAPAKPGEQIILYGTGFGPTNPEVTPGQTFQGAAPLVNPAVIRLDEKVAEVGFAGLSSPGLYQFNLTVPDLPNGDHAVAAEVAGTRTDKIARLRVQR